MINIRQLIDFAIHGRHRLEAIEKLPLGCSLGEAVALYGQAVETKPAEDTPEITQHTFSAGNYHEVVASEWKNTIQSITHWSLKSDPGRDLDCMLAAYGESSEWQILEEAVPNIMVSEKRNERFKDLALAPALNAITRAPALLSQAKFGGSDTLRQRFLSSLGVPEEAQSSAKRRQKVINL